MSDPSVQDKGPDEFDPGPTPTIEVIHDALIAAFDGTKFRDNTTLTAADSPDDISSVGADQLPFLLFEVGSIAFKPWHTFTEWLAWDVPATLKVLGEAGQGMKRKLLASLHDIVQQTKLVTGLPVDDDGRLTPFGDKTMKLFDTGQLHYLAERGAPYVSSFSPTVVDGAFGEAKLVFHLEATLNYDPRILSTVKYFVLGINPRPVGQVLADITLPGKKGLGLTPDDGVLAYGPMATSDPNIAAGTSPLVPPGTPNVPGTNPREVLVSVNATPYAVALSVGTPTAQLTAIAQWGNYRTAYITAQTQWSSSDPTKATVSAAGLVTRVAVGTANITCTYGGVQSNAVTVTCS